MREEIINDIAKKVMIELAKHEVELATITSIVKERGKIAEDYLRASTLASSAGDQVEAILKNIVIKSNTNLDYIEQAKKQVKDLGIENPKELLDAEISAKEYIKRAENNLKIAILFQRFNG